MPPPGPTKPPEPETDKPKLVKLSESDVPIILNIGFKFVDYINYYWSFYLGFIGLGLGWLFSSKDILPIRQRILFTILYILATSMNLFPLIMVYKYFQDTVGELRKAGNTVDTHTKEFKEFLEKTSVVGGWRLAVIVHVLIDLSVLFSIWFLKK